MRFTHHTWVKVALGPSKAQRIPYRRGDIPYIYICIYSYTIIYNHISYIVCKWGFVDPFTKLDAPPSRTFQNLKSQGPLHPLATRVTSGDVQVAVHYHEVAHVALVIEETPALVSHLQARDLPEPSEKSSRNAQSSGRYSVFHHVQKLSRHQI